MMDGLRKPPPGHPHHMPEPEPEKPGKRKGKGDDMAATAAAAKYRELRDNIAEARRKMQETAKGLFVEMSAELFAENPGLVSFGWTQYTPYWNDGDVCVFGAHTDYPTVSVRVGDQTWGYDTNRDDLLIDGKEQESASELARKFQDLGVESFTKNGRKYAYDFKTKAVTVDGNRMKTYEEIEEMFRPLEKAVAAFLRNFEDEDLQTMFGDHVAVEVGRDGTVETEEYEHE